jgi:glycosyltransferase involved in cell wall biosynthesis
MMLDVTVVIPVKNEAANLPDCLASLDGFAEIVVVDSKSTDDTVAIAENAGCMVKQFAWTGGFPKKRNWMLLNHPFKTEWVLFLDADEQVTPAFKAELALKLPGANHSGFWINYSNHFLWRQLKHGVPQRKLALFKVGSGLYERIEDPGWSTLDMEVHEHPALEGRVGEISAPLVHRDFRGLKHFLARHNEYSSWEAHRYLALRGDKTAWGKLYPRQRQKYANLEKAWLGAAYFVQTYFLRGGFRDGAPGFYYAVLKAAYFFEIYVKIREARQRDGAELAKRKSS